MWPWITRGRVDTWSGQNIRTNLVSRGEERYGVLKFVEDLVEFILDLLDLPRVGFRGLDLGRDVLRVLGVVVAAEADVAGDGLVDQLAKNLSILSPAE